MGHRVLVIDHHPQGLQRVVNPLRKAGYEVAVAQTAADGAASFGRLTPDLVFIAARLPRTHGTVLCRELKRTESGSSTPIVLIVEGTAMQIDLPPLDHFGADRLLQKPFSADELLDLTRGLLEPVSATTATSESSDADEALSHALEELDSLDIDSQDPVETSSGRFSMELGLDQGKDIEERIDDLFAEANRIRAEQAVPSMDRNMDADATVLDEVEEKQVPTQAEPVTPKASTTTASATATASIPTTNGGTAQGRFQTEALTRPSAATRTPPAKMVEATFTLPRWSWALVPVAVGLVAVGVWMFSGNGAEPAPAQLPQALIAPQPPADTAGFDELGSTAGFGGIPAAPDESAEAIQRVDPPSATEAPLEKPEPDEPERSTSAKPAPRVETPPSARVVQPEPEPEAPRPQPVAMASETVASDPEPVKPEPTEPETVVPDAVRSELDEPAPTELEPQATEPSEARSEREPEPESTAPVEQARQPELASPPAASEPAPPATEEIVASEPETVEPEKRQDAPEEATEPEPVTRDPILTRHVKPVYQAKDLKKGGGTVVLKVLISPSGAVTRVLVEQGIPGSPLEAAAVSAVLRWKYEPALDRGKPVEAWTSARFTFDE